MKHKKYLFILTWITLILSLLPVRTVYAMSIFDSMKVNLFSEMKGIVTLEGKPVVGALISRTAIPNDEKEYTDSTKTDSEGRFYFDKMETRRFLKLLPGQSTVLQKVIIQHADKQYLAWETFIVSERYKGELNEWDTIGTDKEIDIDLKCELTAKNIDKSAANHVISGICSWNGQKTLD